MTDSSNQLSCKLNSTCDCVHVLSSMVEVMGHRAGLSDKETNRMILAVDEMFANIAQHGYQGREGRVDMAASLQGDVLSFELRDYAPPLLKDEMLGWPEQSEAEDEDITPGGLGMHLMRAVMDKIEHESLADGNRWRLIKSLDGEQDNEA
jgi:anti-sigma regulatory factor (Ser/Thr protein kinase)